MRFDQEVFKSLLWSAVSTALAGLLRLGGCKNGQGRQAAPAPLPEVATVKVSLESVELTTELPGRTSAFLVADIRPAGQWHHPETTLFRKAPTSKPGKVLYQIDPAPFQATWTTQRPPLAKAEANLLPPGQGPNATRNCSPTKRSAGRTTTTRQRP